ncbi:MAG: YdeI/OmpD-associated family protein [Ignavibacteriales bacterium]|nr:YdeI/OmpD-associated family protein [Ignavibacteriales bacterium]
MMEITRTYYAKDRQKWRNWLKKNHTKLKEIWLIYYKKHSGKPGVNYNDAVEEALCFGWIDSNVHRIDEEKYAQRFTPRNVKSRWSKLNINRMKKMIAEGKMTEVGLSKIDLSLLSEEIEIKKRQEKNEELVIPQKLTEVLKENIKAWENFNNLAPSYKSSYVKWIMNAKLEETFRKRTREAIVLLEQNKKLGMK